jgi:hypothetical protein
VLRPRETPVLGGHAGLGEALCIRLRLVGQRVELGGDHECRRQASQVGRAQR